MFVILQKLMNVLIKAIKITVEFNKVKSVEVISGKRTVKYLKRQVNCKGI